MSTTNFRSSMQKAVEGMGDGSPGVTTTGISVLAGIKPGMIVAHDYANGDNAFKIPSLTTDIPAYVVKFVQTKSADTVSGEATHTYDAYEPFELQVLGNNWVKVAADVNAGDPVYVRWQTSNQAYAEPATNSNNKVSPGMRFITSAVAGDLALIRTVK